MSCAALGDDVRGIYALHVVNTGAAKPAVVTGLPRRVRSLRVWTTNARQTMEEGAKVVVRDGSARFTLPSASYVTLAGEGR